ncbi:chaplin family protein [Kitasatospora sp. MBT63]|uniref:chaplin family protein n=1 Tax=Kitasatospora sp. MBT63 TaxID=1444768 RepID=UPI0013148BA5|nr:chaplin family protein [Kitasatospora sp. MBT63]
MKRFAAAMAGAALLTTVGGIAAAQSASAAVVATRVSPSSATASALSFGSSGWISGQVIKIPIYHSINICGAGNTCTNS